MPGRERTAKATCLILGCALAATACSAATGESSEFGVPRATVALAPLAQPAAPITTRAPAPAKPSAVQVTATTAAAATTTAPRPPLTTIPRTAPPVLPKNYAPVSNLSAAPLQPVGRGDGAETKRVQARLIELGFWVSAVDGQYGLATYQAMIAFQKYFGLKASGSVDQATADALTAAGNRATATAVDGTLVEIDKTKQLLFLIENGRTIWVFNTSTGSGKPYIAMNQKDANKIETGDSITPSGVYSIYRQKPDGWWDGDLGKIYRPKYFVGGIAIHGMNTVPNHPVSHGCVRLSLPAMDFIWDNNLVPKGTMVWVHGRDNV